MDDSTYSKIIGNWNEFIECLPDDDRQLLLEITSKCYYKHQKSKVYGLSNYGLSNGLLMSILIEPQI